VFPSSYGQGGLQIVSGVRQGFELGLGVFPSSYGQGGLQGSSVLSTECMFTV
jgi:hypothetical protein